MEPPPLPTFSLFQATHQNGPSIKIGVTRPATSPLKRDEPSVRRHLDEDTDMAEPPSPSPSPSPSPHREPSHPILGRTASPELDKQPEADKDKGKERHVPTPEPNLAPTSSSRQPGAHRPPTRSPSTSPSPEPRKGQSRGTAQGDKLSPYIFAQLADTSYDTATTREFDYAGKIYIPDTSEGRLLQIPADERPRIIGITREKLEKALDNDYKVSFPEYPWHKVYAQLVNGNLTTPTAFLVQTLEDIVALAFDHGTATRVDVCPGAPDLTESLAPPRSPRYRERFYPFAQAIPPKYLHFALTGIALEPDEHGINDRRIANELCNILIKEAEFHKFVDKHSDIIPTTWDPDDDSDESFENIRRRLVLQQLEVKGFMHKGIPIHNIYLPVATTAPNMAEDLLKAIKKIKFKTTKGLGTLANPFLCGTCKSIDHPEASCAYTKFEGWPTKRPGPPPTRGGYSRGYGGSRGGGGRGGRGGYRGERGRGAYNTSL
ncbi:hypothetical protein M422DRAFT_259787 [Sphaerobolus stellatus SS14]|uniref:Uncharacterized protein n=1 Tax=Sphaerobolus stellatus (strain SS14) TaxID=990650 RepID=A0A0C9U422_SPHS4|nr:hypothetical protein M422DRAFT_259787 [Sphaerobolus stellatus SS14]